MKKSLESGLFETQHVSNSGKNQRCLILLKLEAVSNVNVVKGLINRENIHVCKKAQKHEFSSSNLDRTKKKMRITDLL